MYFPPFLLKEFMFNMYPCLSPLSPQLLRPKRPLTSLGLEDTHPWKRQNNRMEDPKINLYLPPSLDILQQYSETFKRDNKKDTGQILRRQLDGEPHRHPQEPWDPLGEDGVRHEVGNRLNQLTQPTEAVRVVQIDQNYITLLFRMNSQLFRSTE